MNNSKLINFSALDPTSGNIGEFLYASLDTSGALALVSGTIRDIVSLPVSAGDWDVQGTMVTRGTSTNITDIVVWVSTQSRTRPTIDNQSRFFVTEINFGTSGSGADTRTQLLTGIARLSTTVPVTVYLSTVITWNRGTVLAAGSIRARRMR